MVRNIGRYLCMLLVCFAVVGCGAPQVQEGDGTDVSEEQQAQTPASEGSDEGQQSYVERDLAVFATDPTAPKSMTLRFYDECPHVPYIGIARYLEVVFEEKTQVDSEGGSATITSADGGTLVAEDADDKLTSNNWLAFRNYIEPMREGKISGFIDFGCPFARIKDISYEEQTAPVVFDLGSYGIDVHVGEDDVYVPLATASDMLADVAMNVLAYNGQELVLSRGYEDNVLSVDGNYYEPITNSSNRDRDMVDFAYAELCFAIDTFYGKTGTGVLDEELENAGLDEVLRTHDGNTKRIRELILSADKGDYLAGMHCLNLYLYDKHTQLVDQILMLGDAESAIVQHATSVTDELSKKIMASRDMLSVAEALSRDNALSEARDAAFSGPDHYHELGDTAMISLDNFMDVDRAGWRRHYSDGEGYPDGTGLPDVIGTLANGIERASANPEIKYVVIDVALNGGGSNDLGATAVALVCGNSTLPVKDNVSGLSYSLTYDIDSLFDGSFNSGVFAAAHKDLKFAVLTSERSFSCGNLFPSRLSSAGIPIIGERSGGGTNMCERMVTPEGFQMQLAGGPFQMCDEDGNSIEEGVPIEISLVQYDERGKKDYHAFYNLEYLSQVMAELYGDEAMDQAA